MWTIQEFCGRQCNRQPSQSSDGPQNLWVTSCHAWCFNPVCFDRFVRGKLRTDSNSLGSSKGFIPWRTTKPSDARKYKPHRPWNLPFCRKNSSMLRPGAWTEALQRDHLSLFLQDVLLGSLLSSLVGKADVVNAEIMYSSAFAMNHLASITRRGFFTQKVNCFSYVALLGYIWLTSSYGRRKAGCPIKYQTSLKTTNIYNSISDQPVSVVKTQAWFKKPKHKHTHTGGKNVNQTSKTLNPPADS